MRRALVLLALLLAGCLEPPSAAPGSPRDDVDEPEEWRFGGAWTSEYTQADIDAWCEIARAYGNECLVMESFPPQYGLVLTSLAQCEEARARVLALEHITARACARTFPATDPEAPTSSPPPDAVTWTLHGTFSEGFTQDDVEAVCVAGAGEPVCNMMKSYPPQYVFTFSTRAECEEARATIAAVPHTRPGDCREAGEPSA